jgi:hypothetical protein
MVTNTAFLDHPLMNLQQPDILNRFGQESGPVTFPLDRVANHAISPLPE